MTLQDRTGKLWRLNQSCGFEPCLITEGEFRERRDAAACLIERVSDHRPQGFLLAFRDGLAVEVFSYQWFMTRFENFLYIDRIIVSPGCRREGLATAMVDEAVQWCLLHGIDSIFCQVHDRPPNPAGHALCRKLGFSAIESVMLPSREIVTMYQCSTARAMP